MSFALKRSNYSVKYCNHYGVPLSIASNMRSEALSIVPHFSSGNFNEQIKSMPFFLRQIAATRNAFKSDFATRLTCDVIE